MEAQRGLVRRLQEQSGWCYRLGSGLYGDLLTRCAADVLDGGPVWDVLRERAAEPGPSMLALRFLGAVHRLVLAGSAPGLAAHYPSVGGTPGPGVWPEFRATVAAHAGTLRETSGEPVQTNEPGRAVALLAGYLLLADRHRMPLRLLEIGASAGLNLLVDSYRYETPYGGWGPADSPLVLRGFLAGPPPPLGAPLEIAARRGCDRSPVDPATEEGRVRLLSFVWPDQVDRLARLRGGLEVAARVPVHVDPADAADWLPEQLADPPAGVVTVVVHSVVWQYVPAASRRRILAALAAAGAAATPRRPLAHLAFEPRRGRFELRLTTWPGGATELAGTAAAHGADLRWLA